MQRAKLPPGATATVTESANLGFPALPDLGGMPSGLQSAASWLSGSHTVQIWYDGPTHVRIALPAPFGETDLRVNGSQVWLWDSKTQTATHILPPAAAAMIGRPIFVKPPRLPRLSGACLRLIRRHVRRGLRVFQPSQRVLRIMRRCVPTRIFGLPFRLPKSLPGCVVSSSSVQISVGRQAGQAGGVPAGLRGLSPIQLARRLLALVGPTTKVSVAGTTTVAGRPAYELAIAPRSGQSLIGQIVIAVDAKTALPLQVQVFARGSSSPAFSVGFSTLAIGKPAMSNFTFTPPPGAHVKTVHLPDPFARFMGAGPAAFPAVFPGPAVLRPVRAFGCPLLRRGSLVAPRVTAPAAASPQVIGSGWLSVLALPASPAIADFVAGRRAVVLPNGGAAAGGVAQYLPWLHMLLNSAARVHGSWGSGRLVRTALFSVLITSKGQVFAGAVTPGVLIADAAKIAAVAAVSPSVPSR